MSNKWFRLYGEFAFDPKVQSMPENMQRRLVMLFCLRSCDVTVTLCDDEIAFALHITCEELSETKALFIRKGFIDDRWNMINWDKRQYASDSSAERMRKHREKKKKDSVTTSLRHSDLLDTDTDTDTDKKEEPPIAPPSGVTISPAVESKPKIKKSTEYSEEFEKFRELYPPNGASKAEAWKSYQKAIKAGVNHEEIERGVRGYAHYLQRTDTPTAHATTWLNQQRWTVDYEALIRAESNSGNGRLPQNDRRDPATRARDSAEEIIAKRRAAREAEAVGRSAIEGKPRSSGSADRPVIPSLRKPEIVR